MSRAETVIDILKAKYTEEKLAGLIDEHMHDYVDMNQCEEEFDGDTYECYMETGNNAAENDIFHQIVKETGIAIDGDDWDKLSDWFTGMGFSL